MAADLTDMDDPIYRSRRDEPPWPEWLTGFRDHQVEAVAQILDAYDRGVEVVFLDAPTGSGKTLIAEMVRRALGTRGVYICNGKDLQDQFLSDYPYAKVLKGRANYPTELRSDLTCEDCTGPACKWCEGKASCPYLKAKRKAGAAAVGVLNTAYYLAEAQSPRSLFAGRGFVVADESDTLEAQLMNAVEFRISEGMARKLGVVLPKKSVQAKTIRLFLLEELLPRLREKKRALDAQGSVFGVGDSVEIVRERNALSRMIGKVERVADGITDEDWGDWVRDYDERHARDLILKPVRVSEQGADMLWRHGEQWLCMSASLISSEEQAESLGVDRAGLSWETVTVPMTFPRENRPIYYRPKAKMTWKERDEAEPKVIAGVAEIVDQYPGENVLVHTVNYALTRRMADELVVEDGRRVWSYTNARERGEVLEGFKRSGGVLLAPSMDRGIDLPQDQCRVCVVAKIPFPSLGDKQVSTRMRTVGGQTWYAVQVARTLVQMTGRGVRSETDACDTYILDGMFGNWWKDGRRLMPGWWKEVLA